LVEELDEVIVVVFVIVAVVGGIVLKVGDAETANARMTTTIAASMPTKVA
jgi:hypothetical protein